MLSGNLNLVGEYDVHSPRGGNMGNRNTFLSKQREWTDLGADPMPDSACGLACRDACGGARPASGL